MFGIHCNKAPGGAAGIVGFSQSQPVLLGTAVLFGNGRDRTAIGEP